MKNRTQLPAALLAALLLALAPATRAAGDTTGAKPTTTAPADGGDLSDGEVRKVDIDNGKLTLKHGEIKSLDMPGMTMVFVVRDKAMLDKLKAGDRIRFRAVNDGGRFTVTEIVAAP